MTTSLTRSMVGAAVVAALLAAGAASTASATVPPSKVLDATSSGGRFTASGLTPATHTRTASSAATSESGRLATSDQALLTRRDTAPVRVMVKLDVDAVASYRGDLPGLGATSPSVTGRALTGGRTTAERAYVAHVASVDTRFRAALTAAVPSATAGRTLTTVYGGLSVRLPADRVSDLLSLPGVAAVQSDAVEHPTAATTSGLQSTPATTTTVESPAFIGAPNLWSRTGGRDLAGKGVILADIDTGLWPEHPMLADDARLGTPPPAPSGKPRACVLGDNPLTPRTDVFVCNHKVIGGRPFLDAYNADLGRDYPEVYPTSARDSDGHGTHTTTTAAGDYVANAPVLGIDRGPISGIAPGAFVLEYKACGLMGCYTSDLTAAIEQAVLDGADVISYSISSGDDPFSDPAELAFRDAYAAGVFVSAAAGNEGPLSGSVNHQAPWVTTVAASTQSREFSSTLTVRNGSQTATFAGTSLTPGVTSPTPVVLGELLTGEDSVCRNPLAPGVATGRIVACARGVVGRIQKGLNVLQGGAAGMILYNNALDVIDPLADTESDNHYLPTIHLPDGARFLAMLAQPGATATFTPGVKKTGRGDVMAAFSSKGPGQQFLKPDISAPGLQVLAGDSPTADAAFGPPGEYYQAIAGTSMSTPHIAGSAVLLKALHPAWSPGAVKSALMTTASNDVLKEDGVTPADPFDDGAGRVDLTQAGLAPLVFDETAARMTRIAQNPSLAPNLNLPSIDLPSIPDSRVVTRTATNVSGQSYRYDVTAVAPAGSRISVTPSSGVIGVGQSQRFSIRVSSQATDGQYFGSISWRSAGRVDVRVPVAFVKAHSDIRLTQSCSPVSLPLGTTSTCTVSARNDSYSTPATVSARTVVPEALKLLTGSAGATVSADGRSATAGPVTLAPRVDAVPSIASTTSSPGHGFVDLAALGMAAVRVGGHDQLTYSLPLPISYGGTSYSSLKVNSDGYAVVGDTDAPNIYPWPIQSLPDADPPNGVLAPYWADLTGDTTPGLRAGVLSDGTTSWVVVQWDVRIEEHGVPERPRSFQMWLRTGGTEGVFYEYAPGTDGVPNDPSRLTTVGAENVTGTSGDQVFGTPTGSYQVSTVPAVPGGSGSYSLTLTGQTPGAFPVTTRLTAKGLQGSVDATSKLTITP